MLIQQDSLQNKSRNNSQIFYSTEKKYSGTLRWGSHVQILKYDFFNASCILFAFYSFDPRGRDLTNEGRRSESCMSEYMKLWSMFYWKTRYGQTTQYRSGFPASKAEGKGKEKV